MAAEVTSSHLFDLVYQSARVMRAEYAKRLQPMHLTPSHTRVLRTLSEVDEPVKVAELAALLEIRPRSATGLLSELIANGLVIRKDHPTDGRAVIVRLSAKGKRTWSRIVSMADDVAGDYFAPLSPTARANVARSLQRALTAHRER